MTGYDMSYCRKLQWAATTIFVASTALVLSGCAFGDGPEHQGQVHYHANENVKVLGQPCSFGWPVEETPEGGTVVRFDQYPVCHPLQNDDGDVSVNNQACPVDCIQMPSLECEEMICMATQVDGDPTHMNGQCWEVEGDEQPKVRCMGYCTRNCENDADCPVGFECAPLAPFAEVLNCEEEDQWGTSCTSNCVPAGETPEGTDLTCPISGLDGDYSVCEQEDAGRCCACLCYRFCQLLDIKVCRKSEWDRDLFPDGISRAEDCL